MDMPLRNVRSNIVQSIRAFRVQDLQQAAQSLGQHFLYANLASAQSKQDVLDLLVQQFMQQTTGSIHGRQQTLPSPGLVPLLEQVPRLLQLLQPVPTALAETDESVQEVYHAYRELSLSRQGLKQIVVQLPGVKEPKRAKDLIKETALLEFKMLDEENQMKMDFPVRVPKEKEAEVLAQFQAKVPEGDQILFEHQVDKDTGREFRTPYLVKKRVMLTGDVLSDARVSIGEFNDPYVSITFDGKGGREFERITGENIKKRMAVVLDNTIYSAPVIQDRISGGRAQITGTFSTQEANDLAIVLRAGALPAPLKIIQDLTVGPSLGQDSIDQGMKSTLIAGLLVVIFMMVYYRLSGVIADFALLLNLICLLGALSALNATLTLPGIAGIVLTIGMGVDSNVLIFERIREELRAGKAVRLAVDGGYDKALLTIIDAHVTTLITGVALFLFGTGPIKGFAVTLCLGIAINLFTAFVGTKVVFDLLNQGKKVDTLSI